MKDPTQRPDAGMAVAATLKYPREQRLFWRNGLKTRHSTLRSDHCCFFEQTRKLTSTTSIELQRLRLICGYASVCNSSTKVTNILNDEEIATSEAGARNEVVYNPVPEYLAGQAENVIRVLRGAFNNERNALRLSQQQRSQQQEQQYRFSCGGVP
jgi:hypothetical protein